MSKETYFKYLEQLLRDHYNHMKDAGSGSSDSQQFIDGYLTAARALNAVYQKELADFAEKIHFEIFHMTIEERRKSSPVPSDLSEDDLKRPAYERRGIIL